MRLAAGGRAPVGFGPQRRSDNEAPAKQREQAGVSRGGKDRALVGFASVDATSAEVTGGAGGRVPVGFGPQIRKRSRPCAWDLAPGKQRERAGVSRTPMKPAPR